jgi:hypothetical protein
MALSNIYLRLITMTWPILGEGLLEGWETAIELKDFNWGIEAELHQKGGMSVGSLIGMGQNVSVQMHPLKFTKRFDVASHHIHFCIDNKIKILSATITVLHMKPGFVPPHAPGFVLNCADGYFESTELELGSDGMLAELTETVTVNFGLMQMLYMKPVPGANGQPVPTAPFFYPNPVVGI